MQIELTEIARPFLLRPGNKAREILKMPHPPACCKFCDRPTEGSQLLGRAMPPGGTVRLSTAAGRGWLARLDWSDEFSEPR